MGPMQPESDTSSPRSQSPRCALHEEALATTICNRCGSYACMRCHRVGPDGQDYCHRCVSTVSVLADRGTRFVANLVDQLIVFAPWIGCLLLVVLLGGEKRISPLLSILGLLGTLGMAGYQAYLAARNGQTLGKRMMGIRVVRTDGSPVDLVRILLLRNVVPMAINAACGIFSLVDSLFIFGEDRRCLHDHIADTKGGTVGQEERS